MSKRGVTVVARHWHDHGSELSFVTRGIAGAASRWGPVDVLVPAPVGSVEADGAFDLVGIGEGADLAWPDHVPGQRTILVDDATPGVVHMLRADPGSSVLVLSGGAPSTLGRRVHLVTGDPPTAPSCDIHVPVNRLAEVHHHHGFGFTGYLLVLSGRTTRHDAPPPAVAWLSAAFHDAEVVVVENAVASAWRGRALRGTVSVDARMDLWRLMAHARVCIDLAPGPHIARECVESLRFGTPIVVPEGSGAAAVHAERSGGSAFSDPAELLSAVAKMRSDANRSVASMQARRYADSRYGDPDHLVSSVGHLLARS